MTKLAAPHRRATSEDVPELPELVNLAGDGLSLYLWAKLAGADESPWDVAVKRARSGKGGFAYENTVIREEGGKIAACLIGYPLSSAPQLYNLNDVPAMVAPLYELEHLVPGTWYVNVLATFPEFQGNGIGTELLHVAETFDSERRLGARRSKLGFTRKGLPTYRMNVLRRPVEITAVSGPSISLFLDDLNICF